MSFYREIWLVILDFDWNIKECWWRKWRNCYLGEEYCKQFELVSSFAFKDTKNKLIFDNILSYKFTCLYDFTLRIIPNNIKFYLLLLRASSISLEFIYNKKYAVTIDNKNRNILLKKHVYEGDHYEKCMKWFIGIIDELLLNSGKGINYSKNDNLIIKSLSKEIWKLFWNRWRYMKV